MTGKVLAWTVAGVVYLLWPFDLIPDFLALVGWVDDLLIAGFSFYMAWRTFKRRLNAPAEDVIDVEIEKGDKNGR